MTNQKLTSQLPTNQQLSCHSCDLDSQAAALRWWTMGEPKFVGSTPVPPLERAMEGRRLRIAQ